MENIWSFLLQTLSVSLIGLLLLVVKLLLRNRLSPRWQYAVWGVLAVRLMVPASTYGKDIFLPLPLWVETVKLTVEQGLSSAYTAFYEAVRVVAPVPWLSGGPVSVTDWLFLLYILGVFGMLGWELFASLFAGDFKTGNRFLHRSSGGCSEWGSGKGGQSVPLYSFRS